MTDTAASFATSVAGRKVSETDDLEAQLDELSAIVDAGGSSSSSFQTNTRQRIELEDRAKEPIEVQNLIKAAELAYTADVNARSANLLTDADTSSDDDDDINDAARKARVYKCDSSCAHDTSGACLAACVKWNQKWEPIMKLLGDACNDHAAAFAELPRTTTTVSSLTSIQARFAALARDNAPLLVKSGAPGRDAFVARAYDELCNQIGREFHQVRATIRGQMCCVDTVACEVEKLVREVMGAFSGSETPWLTQTPAELGRHLSRCSPKSMAEHVKTLENTGAQLAIFEKAMFQLTDGCAEIVERLRTQLSALLQSKPVAKKPAAVANGDWRRKSVRNALVEQDSYTECIYGHTNCSEDDFVGALRAFLDAESDCSRIVYNGSVFFRDCYQNLAWYMKHHLKRTEQLQTAFNSLGDVLVQQRFIVHIGVALMCTIAKLPLHVNVETGRKETPMEVFHFLFGPTFRSTMPDADYYPIQLELGSKGAKLQNTLRTYLYKVHTARHMNAIQKAGSALFTAELDCLAEAVAQCASPDFDTSDVVVAANRDRTRAGLAELRRLSTALLKYVDKKHPCVTGSHCACCPTSKPLNPSRPTRAK
jgi:hypothetical protein